MLWIYLHINKFYLFLIQTRSCRNNPLDLSHCHFEPYCWEMNVLQVYETVLKSEIYQMYSTAEAQNSPQPRVCPEGGQRATLSPHEPRQSERKYTSKAGQKYQLALRRRASQRPPRTRERLPTAARHTAGDIPLGTTTSLGKGKTSLLCICRDAGGHPEVGLEHHRLPGGAESSWWPLQGLRLSWGTMVAAPRAQPHPGSWHSELQKDGVVQI